MNNLIRHIAWYIYLCVVVFLFNFSTLYSQVDYTQYANPFIGTSGHGHTYPAAALPFSMVQLGPDTDTIGWDWCSGYHYSDSSLLGFSHTHLSGTGIGSLCDILVTPYTGQVTWKPGTKENPDQGYRSRFSHKNEQASPGYYSVFLDDFDIKAEMTVSQRVGFHKYTYPESAKSHVLFDLGHVNHQNWRKGTIWTYITVLNDTMLTGYKISNDWATDRHIYFAAIFSRPFQAFSVLNNDRKKNNLSKHIAGKVFEGGATNLKCDFLFQTKTDEHIMLKVAVSPVSMAGAMANLKEIPHWNFSQTRNKARELWNKELSKIDIEADDEQKTIFYTALYHSFLAPYLFMDINNEYRGLDKNKYTANGFNNYTVFSLWDTYRALHPLLTLVQKNRVNDMIKSMLAHYQQSPHRKLPVWSLQANETWCMIGDHAVPVIVDAYLKGIRDYDTQLAYQAVKTSLNHGKSIDKFLEYKYIPFDFGGYSVSRTLETSLDNYAAARFARALNKTADYRIFTERAGYFKNLYDSSVGFFRGKDTSGNWREPFDPAYASYSGDYTEANAYQYLWAVQHDVPALIELTGGKEAFVERLDNLFVRELEMNENAPGDMSGFIGQYVHGNEPSHHIGYLYNYAGVPHKTQEKVCQILQMMYTDKPDGLCGNEDCGQMSAWYIFSALGFYPVNPVGGNYQIGSPRFEKATINFDSGKKFIITAKHVSAKNKYIRSVLLNGKPLNTTTITHDEINQGGHIEFVMTGKPANWPD